VPRHDILCGSITLERAVDGFPAGSVHLAVVDPGVGTDRRILVAQINQQHVVCPDNGLITWAWRRLGPGRAFELLWRPPDSSSTFHGRDIMAPAAAMIACGQPLEELARPLDDHFGNATTNLHADVFKTFGHPVVSIRRQTVGKLRRTYWDVPPGKALALIGSSGLLEIAVRDGSAAEQLKIRVGDEVVLGG
jgi:S-adenosylmethionine hydrolase